MNKADRLKHLPPAARVASVRVYDERGGLLVVTRYVEKPRDWSSRSVHPGEELWGVAYETWKQHLGHHVRLWEWHGTDEGMIGGPARRQADFTFFGTLWEFPETLTREMQVYHADDLERWLADDRYEFSERCRKKVETMIARLRRTPRVLSSIEEALLAARQEKTAE